MRPPIPSGIRGLGRRLGRAAMSQPGQRITVVKRLRVALKRRLARLTTIIEFCKDCGRTQPLVWAADDELWAVVSGRTDGGGVLCPECFDRRSLAQGRLLMWVPMRAVDRP